MIRVSRALFFLSLIGTSSSYLPAAVPQIYWKHDNHPQHGASQVDRTVRNSFSLSPSRHRQSSSVLRVGNWWEDDLPNILGINPFEAALLFGALYKFYGPGVLYEFAREAGKLFSTYAPIVRDLSLDIFNEGKDYLEEDRDRELMRKGGVDIDNMPRKTTNIIERFQAGMEVGDTVLRSVLCSLILSAP